MPKKEPDYQEVECVCCGVRFEWVVENRATRATVPRCFNCRMRCRVRTPGRTGEAVSYLHNAEPGRLFDD